MRAVRARTAHGGQHRAQVVFKIDLGIPVDVFPAAADNFKRVPVYIGGYFAADAAKGARPRDLSPVFESPVSMALNLFMATLIGWNPPLEVLAAVDEFYQEMK